MHSPALRAAALVLFLLASALLPLRADAPVSPGILDPKTASEAWNVIRLATKNVERLLDEQRLAEIPVQISFCSPALRALARLAASPEALAVVTSETSRASGWVVAIARAAEANNPTSAKDALSELRGALTNIARHFDPKTTAADIFICPMHSDFLSDNAKTPCAKCGMDLLPRRIPYSFIYTKPGEPSIRMTATASGPLEAGRKMEVRVRLERADKSPVTHDDLMVMHTQPIHLLIEDPSLGDYHHEHPIPTKTPGEYTFSFTPAKTSPYRIWADLVPSATGVQELPFADLPSADNGKPVADTGTRYTASVDGYHFTLTMAQGNHIPVQALRARGMTIAIADAGGKPVTHLEAVMNAFAHLVGFYSDYQTVVHLHPTGGDVLDEKLRGGPALGFLFFPPKAGFIRLYCQVNIGGKMLFAPFNVNVEP